MKKKLFFTILAALNLCNSGELFAAQINPPKKSPYHCPYGNCKHVCQSSYSETVVSNNVFFSIYSANGFFYVNGIPIGPEVIKDVRSDGVYYLNNHPIEDYSNGKLNKESFYQNPYYLRAYYKFLLEDYSGAIEDCNKALLEKSKNPQIITLKNISQSVISKSISSQNAQNEIIKNLNDSKNIILTKEQDDKKDYSRCYEEIVSANNLFIQIILINGIFYANGIPIGETLTKAFGIDGMYYINKHSIVELTSINYPKETPYPDQLYLEAFYKFSFKDYRGALADSSKALSINQKNYKATALFNTTRELLDGKIDEKAAWGKVLENAKTFK